MKTFDLSDYFKPMISRAGRIASRKNKYFLKSVTKYTDANYIEDTVEQRYKQENKKSPKLEKKKTTGSYSFKTVSRRYANVTDSPPPNRYTPKYDYVLKSSPTATFTKDKVRDIFGKIEDYTANIPSSISPRRIPGIPFDKQLTRKLHSNDSPLESKNEIQLSSSTFKLPHKVHSFKAYTPRKNLFKISEFQPDYRPNYSFVSKLFKDTKKF